MTAIDKKNGKLTIIAGDREWTDMTALEEAIEESGFKISCVVSGCARGVDKLGERWAQQNGVGVRRFPADWKRYRRGAGPIRNRKMAEVGEQLIALPAPHSRGTRDMIKQAEEHGLRVFVKEIFPDA